MKLKAADIIAALELNLNGHSQNHRLLAGKLEWQINNRDQKWLAFIKRAEIHNNTVAAFSLPLRLNSTNETVPATDKSLFNQSAL